jgi:outer membrane protein TolC
MIKKIFPLVVIPFTIYAQDLSKLVEESFQNQSINATRYNVESIKDQYESIQNTYYPTVSVGATYNKTNEETATTPDNSTASWANINYVVYDGGKRGATSDALESSISGANENLTALKNNTALQVITYYFNYYSLLSQKEAKLREIEQLNAQYKRLKRFLDVGTTTSDEVDKIVSRVQSATVMLHEIELDVQTIIHNLQYLTTQDINIESGSTMKDVLLKQDSLRADIKALEHEMNAQLSTARASKSSNYPILTLDDTYTNYDFNYDNPAYQNAVTMDDQNILKVSASWKIFDFGATTRTYESNYKKYLSLKSQYEYEKNKASIDLKLAIKSYEIGKLKIMSAQSALKAANSTYNTIEKKYQNGLVDNVAYLEALSEKYSAISALKSSQYDLEIKKANIIYYSGKNLEDYIQ